MAKPRERYQQVENWTHMSSEYGDTGDSVEVLSLAEEPDGLVIYGEIERNLAVRCE
jgi:hypothetical protein